jgi:hypothetical protein
MRLGNFLARAIVLKVNSKVSCVSKDIGIKV